MSALGYNLNLLFDLPAMGRVTPYVVGGVGVEQYGFAETSPAGNFVAQSRTALSVNAGGGVRIRGDEHWGVRADARWSNGLGSRAPERLRLYNGVTFGRQQR